VRRGLVVLALFLASPGAASAATNITFGVDPAVPTYGATASFSGTVTPAGAGQTVELIADTGSGWAVLASTATAADGTYSIPQQVTAPGSYAAQTSGATSPAIALSLKPRLTAAFFGLPYLGSPLFLRGQLSPGTAGTLALHIGTRIWAVTVGSDGRYRVRLPTGHRGLFTATIKLTPTAGFEAVQLSRNFRVKAPALSLGSRGKAVLALERELHARHYVLRGVDSVYRYDTYEAVLAFQKVHWLSRTGRVTTSLWAAINRSGTPRAQVRSGNHIEVSKSRQVLFEVRRGAVVRVVHVSTGATGNTPVGHWRVYSKTPGLNSHGMYYSNYFLRGFAIHGYASVPAYPASHGCVRTPMWFAPGFYSRWGLGTLVYVFG
jgi:hypothetical protein